jgi:hypothetical protein
MPGETAGALARSLFMPFPTRELALDGAAVLVVAALSPELPRSLPIGDLVLGGAVVLLLQGLVRDLWRKATAPKGGSTREISCVCVESTVGLTAIVAGLLLTLAWRAGSVLLPPAALPIGFAAVLLFGTAVREVVFDWRALRLRREPDHGARVTWRGGSSS